MAEAELVSITSDEERKMLYQEFKKMGLPGAGNFFWIGLHRNVSGSWHWTDRNPFKYQHWQGPHGLHHYQCVKSALTNENSGWFKASCSEKHNYVCKVKRGNYYIFQSYAIIIFHLQ